MASLNVSLPKTLRQYVKNQVVNSGFSTPSEYVRSLIRDDQKRKATERIEALLLAGIASGEPMDVNRAYWSKKRATLISSRRKSGR